MRKSLQHTSVELIKLIEFVETQTHGTMISYSEAQEATGVSMTRRNRDRLRRAILACKREYVCYPQVGYRLANPAAVMPILAHRLVRIDNAVHRAGRAQAVLQVQFLASLPPDQQEAVLRLGAVFGAIRVAAEQGRKLYGKRIIELPAPSPAAIPIPEMPDANRAQSSPA